jgi:putative ABC transport system ATP-binding protein
MKQIKPIQALAQMINVTRDFSDSQQKAVVLDHVSFTINSGELVLILGPSGSGKSTFLTIMAGLQPPSDGEVWLFGKELHQYSESELQQLRADHIGFIFQTFHLIDSLTAIENVLLIMQFSQTKIKNKKEMAMGLLNQFGIGYLANKYPKTMSQGEKQRVAIARALANKAELLIADEPTGSLSSEQGMKIVQLLHQEAKINKRGVVIASHDQRIAEYADRVLYIKDGVISNHVV